MLFATLANADTWEEIEDFARSHEEYLRKYLELKNGIPSHDTIQRAMGMIRTEQLQQLQLKWQEIFRTLTKAFGFIVVVDIFNLLGNEREEYASRLLIWKKS